MNKALGFTSAVYGFGAGIFSLGYFIFEVPSKTPLSKVGARRWIALNRRHLGYYLRLHRADYRTVVVLFRAVPAGDCRGRAFSPASSFI